MTQRNPQALEVWADRDIRRRAITLTLLTRGGGSVSVAQPLTMVTTPEAEVGYLDPTIVLQFEDAATMMDEMWKAGVRPTDLPQSSAGEIEALKSVRANLLAEIDFLRTLVRHHLGIV